MAKNFVQDGKFITCIAPAGGVVSGTSYLIGTLFVVAMVSAAATDEFEGAAVGVWNLPKTSANTPVQGAAAYWNDTAKEITTTSSGNTLVGIFTKAYGNGDLLADVRIG